MTLTAICFVMAILAWGTVFYGHSIYMNALMHEHGWSSGLISSAILVFWLASLPGALFVGVLIDRYGPAPVVAIGGLCIGGGLCGLATIGAPWHIFPIYAAMGFGYPALAAAAISATLAPRFERGFGIALGIALTGASVGGAVVPVLIMHSTATRGFGPTMTSVGATLLAIVLCLVICLIALGRPKPTARTELFTTPFSMAGVLRRPLFWRISIAAALGLGGQVGFLAHQVPIITTHTDQTFASFMITVIAVSAAVGRLVIGLLSRHLSINTLAALSYLLHGAGIALLATSHTEVAIFMGCMLAGLVVGAIVILPPIIVRGTFGTVGYGRTYAMVNVVMYVLAGFSPWIVGLLRDTTGGYTTGLAMLVAMESIAALLILRAISTTRHQVN